MPPRGVPAGCPCASLLPPPVFTRPKLGSVPGPPAPPPPPLGVFPLGGCTSLMRAKVASPSPPGLMGPALGLEIADVEAGMWKLARTFSRGVMLEAVGRPARERGVPIATLLARRCIGHAGEHEISTTDGEQEE